MEQQQARDSKNAKFWRQARMFLKSACVLIVCFLVKPGFLHSFSRDNSQKSCRDVPKLSLHVLWGFRLDVLRQHVLRNASLLYVHQCSHMRVHAHAHLPENTDIFKAKRTFNYSNPLLVLLPAVADPHHKHIKSVETNKSDRLPEFDHSVPQHERQPEHRHQIEEQVSDHAVGLDLQRVVESDQTGWDRHNKHTTYGAHRTEQRKVRKIVKSVWSSWKTQAWGGKLRILYSRKFSSGI